MNPGIKKQYKETLYIGLGLACLGIGLNAVSNFSKSEYPVLFVEGRQHLPLHQCDIRLSDIGCFSSTYGIWMILATPVLFCWQGMFYLIAKISSTAISEALIAELLIVGGLIDDLLWHSTNHAHFSSVLPCLFH